jgi:hypothetical protein
MKVIDTPRTGKIANQVAYLSPFGQCYRQLVIPRDTQSPARSRMRDILGATSNGWSLRLTEPQRQRWTLAAQNAPSHPSLGQYSHLSGQQFYNQINSTLLCVGRPPVDEPPAPVAFGPCPVGDLAIVPDPQGNARLRLDVGAVTEDIMLFGQAPCSPGRMKPRRVVYLGLLGPATNGQCDITDLYVARLGPLSPGRKIFIITRQHRSGWQGPDHVSSGIVPP